MNNDFYDIQSSLGFLTITANRLMSAYFRKQAAELGLDLTAEQWGVLVQLWNRSGIAQDEVAHIVCVDKSSLSRVLDVMERKGLVERKRDPADARRKTVYATEAAESLKAVCRKAADKSMEKVLRGINQQDHDICLAVLRKVKENLREITE